MKKMYLVRHGKSSWKYTGVRDLDRPLKERGVHDSEAVSGELAKNNPKIDKVFTSPSARTVSTALIFSRRLAIPFQKIEIREELYDAFLSDFADFVTGISDEYSSVLLTIHNPLITIIAQKIAGMQIGNVPTAGLIEMELNIDSWRDFSENTRSENSRILTAKTL